MNALEAILNLHNVRLSTQPEDVRAPVVSDLQVAGVPVDPDTFQVTFTYPAQIDHMLEVYKRDGVLPSDASIG